MKKRLIALFIAVLLLTLLPVFAHAEEKGGEPSRSLKWEFDESTGTLTVTGSGDMSNYSYMDDSGIQNLPPWSAYLSEIKTIILPDGLWSIGRDAFRNCTKLESITIPDSVKEIRMHAFKDCTSLKTIYFGSGAIQIGQRAFDGCTALKTITLPGSVENVEDEAFRNCTAMTSATLEPGVKSIDANVFRNCKKLTSIKIGDGIEHIGESAFRNTGWWDAQPNGVLYIDHCLIGYKESYPQDVVIRGGTKMIADYALWGCLEMKSVTIPDSVEYIGKAAFGTCRGLTSLTIPYGVKSIGQGAFSRVENIKTIVIPDSVTFMGVEAFQNCTALESVTLSNNLERIEQRTFSGCSALKTIVIPDSVTEICKNAFSKCTSLTSITIPETMTKIYEEAFSGCTGLKSITVPCGLGLEGFNDCKSIDTVHITKGTGRMYDYFHSYQYTPWYRTEADAVTVTLDEGIEYIGQYAFYQCEKLRSFTIPYSVTTVGYHAFSGCTNLKDVYYNGTKSDRETMLTVLSDNDPLLTATWHYVVNNDGSGTVEWNAEDVQFKGSTPYVIANGSAQTPRFTVKNKADGSVIDPQNYDYEYRENTNAGTGYVFVTFKGDYSGTCRGSFKIYLQPTTTTTVENVKDGIRLTWSLVPGAAGYVIYRRAWSSTTNGWTTFERWNNVTGTTYIDGADASHKVYAGTRYQYGIKAYFSRRLDPVTKTYIGGNVGDNFNLGEVGPLKTTVRITTRTLNSVTAGTKQMTVKWSASSVFTGYQIKYATDANFTKNVKAFKITNPKTVQTVIDGLTSGTTYYVTVRSYHEFNGMTYFGEWSNVKSCKVK